jgi:23S rRNA pseudouridine2457 synthase
MSEPLKYILFYKPYGVVTAFTDDEGHETLKPYIDVPDVYPVGRLDLDSEGLLLLTDDGPLAHALTDPHFNHPKTYLVQVEGLVTVEALRQLEEGVLVKGKITRRCEALLVSEPELPPRAKPVTPHGPTSWLRLVLREGKKRQIRHMTAAVGCPTLRLIRVAIGPLSLGDLKPGEWRALTPAEVERLKTSLKSTAGRTAAGSPGSAPGFRYRNGARRSSAPGNRPSGAGGRALK